MAAKLKNWPGKRGGKKEAGLWADCDGCKKYARKGKRRKERIFSTLKAKLIFFCLNYSKGCLDSEDICLGGCHFFT
jgi:hypothetical protein